MRLEDDEAGRGDRAGRYANCLAVGHNAFEFVLDFGQSYGEASEPTIHTRIVTGPHYAKHFLTTLHTAVEEYEREFGVIGDGR
jgi:hypothetical protein